MEGYWGDRREKFGFSASQSELVGAYLSIPVPTSLGFHSILIPQKSGVPESSEFSGRCSRNLAFHHEERHFSVSY